jgi:hypothetical protein
MRGLGVLLLLLVQRSVVCPGCPPDFVHNGNACHVVTFAYVMAPPDPTDLASLQWQQGLRVFQNHTNGHGGLRLGQSARGYVNITATLSSPVHPSTTAEWILAYKSLCKIDDATVLIAPFAAGTGIVSPVIGVIREHCPNKVILSAGGDDHAVDDSQQVWSIYGRPRNWAEQPVRYLHALGARTFAVGGRKGEPACGEVMRGVTAAVKEFGDATVLGDTTTVSDTAVAVQMSADVFIGTGTDNYFSSALDYFDSNCYKPNGALFIEVDGHGPAVGPFRIAGQAAGLDGNHWLATLPWSVEMGHMGPSLWPPGLEDRYQMTDNGSFSKLGAERYLGGATFFAETALKLLSEKATFYHAAAAATLLMFQMAVELAPDADGYGLSIEQVSEQQRMADAMRALDVGTFWGPLNLTSRGDNAKFQMGLVQVQPEGEEPKLLQLGAKSFDTGAKPYPVAAASWGLTGGNSLGSRCNLPWLWYLVGSILGALCVGLVAGGLWCRSKRPQHLKDSDMLSLLTKSLLGGSGEMPESVLAELDVPARWQKAEWDAAVAEQGKLAAASSARRTPSQRRTAPMALGGRHSPQPDSMRESSPALPLRDKTTALPVRYTQYYMYGAPGREGRACVCVCVCVRARARARARGGV